MVVEDGSSHHRRVREDVEEEGAKVALEIPAKIVPKVAIEAGVSLTEKIVATVMTMIDPLALVSGDDQSSNGKSPLNQPRTE